MEFSEKLLLVAVCCWRHLLPPEHAAVLVDFWLMKTAIFAGQHNEQTLPQVERLMVKFIDGALALYGDDIDRPNLHNLIEFVKRDLRIWGSSQILKSGPYESHHQGKFSRVCCVVSFAYVQDQNKPSNKAELHFLSPLL